MENKQKTYFVSGIGTDVGKTVVSALLVEAMQADYWKPIQAGDLHHSDTDKVRALVANRNSQFHPNAYALKTPASPHYAAELDGVDIELAKISKPNTENSLIIEGAGGLMVPLNSNELILDLVESLSVEVILVMNNYLGSINHSLLTLEVLKQRKIPLKGIIFCGETYAPGENYILSYSGARFLGRVPHLKDLSAETIHKLAEQYKFLKDD
tara:strand:+ start:108 stop:740 length:633 start_codon:yes stop_codon:yes gene_type:complete